jgi:hypothetical protein
MISPNPAGEFFKATYGAKTTPAKGKKEGTAKEKGGVLFEYIGKTAMTVRGPFSGKVYRFEHPGATAMTDPRDYRVLLTVPGLRIKESGTHSQATE